MFLKHGIEVFNFGLQSSSSKPKEYDTDMGKLLVKEMHYSIPRPLTDTAITNTPWRNIEAGTISASRLAADNPRLSLLPTGSRRQHCKTARVDEMTCVIKQDAGKDQYVLQ